MGVSYFLSLVKGGTLDKELIEVTHSLTNIVLSKGLEIGAWFLNDTDREITGIKDSARDKLPMLIKFIETEFTKEGFASFNYQDSEISGAINISKKPNFVEFSLTPDTMDEKDIELIMEIAKQIFLEIGCGYGYLWSDSSTNEMLPDIEEILKTNRVTTLYDINFWNPKIVKNIGSEKIEKVKIYKPYCLFETLKDGSVLLALPIELYKGDFVGFDKGKIVAAELGLDYG